MSQIIRVETISQVHEFLNLPKPKHPLVSVLPVDQRLTGFDYGDATYVCGFYQVSLKSGLQGSITYGRNNYDFDDGVMMFTKPDQAITIENDTEPKLITGWTLLFHPDLIHTSELGKSIENYSFFSYDVHEALHLSEDEKRSLTELANKISMEYNQSIDRYTQKLIIANIELILDYSTRFYDRQFYVRSNLNKSIVTRFENLLREYFNSISPLESGVLSVKYCGERLNMSSSYLSDLLKKETGKNAQQYIQDYIINRAKTLLLSTDEQVSQIAYSLGFEYPQHFSQLFKKKTGMTPIEFRRTH